MKRHWPSWKNISISKKLYFVFGVMAFLIAGELITLRFAMHTLSAVRAFVGGEGLWSKAQKNAVFRLQRFGVTRDEADYQAFLSYLRIPEGDHRARQALSARPPDLAGARAGFLDGGIHPDDITPMIGLLTRFYWIKYLSRAIEVWADADRLLEQLRARGQDYHELLGHIPRHPDQVRLDALLESIRRLNSDMTIVEDEFSRVLGEGSRWLENVIITLLFLAVLTAESVGLTLTFLTSRSISRGLSEISAVAGAIGQGDFKRRVEVRSRDEIGRVGASVNEMGALLDKSYQDLERRVRERTHELDRAVAIRDEFLSIASHELKTPLTSFRLLIRIRKRALETGDTTTLSAENLKKMLDDDERQFNRLNRLIDDMLDTSRLMSGKLTLRTAPMDLSALVGEVVERFAPEAQSCGSKVTVDRPVGDTFEGRWDALRLEQVVTNLLTNAFKYGQGRPIKIALGHDGPKTVLTVSDHGIGIAEADQGRIFQQFERAVSQNEVAGLGLGLYITQQIVVAHGGSLSVLSKPGEGSQFRVELTPWPDTQPPAQPALRS